MQMQAVLLSRFSHVGVNVTLTSWLTQWNVLAMHDPAFTQVQFPPCFNSYIVVCSMIIYVVFMYLYV